MPTAYGAEFRQDVIDVARKGEAPLAQIAKDTESAELRELKKRNRLLEQENDILRRAAAYLARDINPK